MFQKKDKIRITTDRSGKMGYKRYCKEGAADALNMLAYAVAREMQYMCRDTDKMKAGMREFEKGALRIACELYGNRPKVSVKGEDDE